MTKMRTIELPEYGVPDVMTFGERDRPKPTESQVLIKITAFGVNGPDIIQRRGHYPPPPGASDLMGLEVSGTVVDKGEKVEKWAIGDTLCGLTNGGGYAEYVAVEADHCLPIPDNVSTIDAAGLPETYFTVWNNAFYQRDISPGTKMLVHGGAGGIGSTAIQIGSALGMEVFATSGQNDGCSYCEEIGAARAINYNSEDFVEILKAAGGADVIIDIVGGDYIERNLQAAAADGRIHQLAFNQGSRVEVNLMPIMLKRLTLTGSTLRPRTKEFKAAIAADLQKQIWPLFANGSIKSTTHSVFSFDEIKKAHEMMEAKQHRGKILIAI